MILPTAGFSDWIREAAKLANNAWITSFFMAIFLDLLTGYAKAFFPNSENKLESSRGMRGLVKHSALIICVVVVYPWFAVLKLDTISNPVIAFWTINYVISILENLNEMGIPFPIWISDNVNKISKSINIREGFDEFQK